MSTTFRIVGKDLHELSKTKIYEYFQRFGGLSDHIVRSKTSGRPQREDDQDSPAGFTISFRDLSISEEELCGIRHFVQGIEIRCIRSCAPVSVSDRKVFIKYLDKKAQAEDIEQALQVFGRVEAVHLSMKKDRSLNLGLCNVLFADPQSVRDILAQPALFIRGKKVKVELFQSLSSAEGSEARSSSAASSIYSPYIGPRCVPSIDLRLAHKPYTSPYSRATTGSKAKTEKKLATNNSSDSDRPYNIGESSHHSKEGRQSSGDPFVYTTAHANRHVIVNSLDFSEIQEECEDSPRPRLGSESMVQPGHDSRSPRRLSPLRRSPLRTSEEIVSIYRPICSEVDYQASIKGLPSFGWSREYSGNLKPTQKEYFAAWKNQHSSVCKNHGVSNVRLNLLPTSRDAPEVSPIQSEGSRHVVPGKEFAARLLL